MKRGTLSLLTLPMAALFILACARSGGEEGGQASASEAPTAAVTIAPTVEPVPQIEEPVHGADTTNLQLVAVGEVLYQQHCASCHGAELEGQPNWKMRDENGYLPAPPHDETGHTWHHPDEQLFEITKIGTEAFVGMGYRSNMLGFEEQLDDSEIWAVLSYIKSKWSTRIQRAQPK